MACIKTLNKAITYDCQPGSVGIAEMYLINFDDVTGGTVDPATGILSGVTLKSGAKTIHKLIRILTRRAVLPRSLLRRRKTHEAKMVSL